jgi:IS6 family transposase
VIFYAPKILHKLKWYWKPKGGFRWRVDKTYVKVKGKWVYLYRAIDKYGDTIDFYLSFTRSTNAARRFLVKALKSIPEPSRPNTINTDKNPPYGKAILGFKAEGKCSEDLEHRQVKYLNNIIESDHGKLKRLIKPTLGFKPMKTAYATIKGFEIMSMLKKGKFELWKYGQGIQGEIRIITDNLLAA